MLEQPLKISIVIPAYNAGEFLDECLDAIERLALPPSELLVIDDGSTDGAIERASQRGVRIISTGGRSGAAAARNLGANATTGDILLFLDADVAAQSDLTERVAAAMADPTVDALIGSYDDDPGSRDFLSQYKNLMHCFVHQTARSEASTFWSGCGAIRRSVFMAASGFDVNYKRAAIEDIELGYRLRRDNKNILLDRTLRVKHLKKWTFWNLLKSDVLDRGIPWTEIILRDHHLPNDLNLQISQRVSIGLVYLMVAFTMMRAVRWGGYALVPMFAIIFILLSRYWSDGVENRSFAVCAVMILTAAGIIVGAWHIHMLVLIPLIVASLPLLFLRHRYDKRGRLGKLNAWFNGLYVVGVVMVSMRLLQDHRFLTVVVACAALIAILNNGFYLFLAKKRGRLFALAAFPFHLLYHFYNGVSFAVGTTLWSLRNLTHVKVAPECLPRSAEADKTSTS